MNDGVNGDGRPLTGSDESYAKEDDIIGDEAPQQDTPSPITTAKKMTYAEATKEGMRMEKLGNKEIEFHTERELQDGELDRQAKKRLVNRAHGGGART